jgi:hypothetical protein
MAFTRSPLSQRPYNQARSTATVDEVEKIRRLGFLTTGRFRSMTAWLSWLRTHKRIIAMSFLQQQVASGDFEDGSWRTRSTEIGKDP